MLRFLLVIGFMEDSWKDGEVGGGSVMVGVIGGVGDCGC